MRYAMRGHEPHYLLYQQRIFVQNTRELVFISCVCIECITSNTRTRIPNTIQKASNGTAQHSKDKQFIRKWNRFCDIT